MHKGIIYCPFRIRKIIRGIYHCLLLLRRLCAESEFGGNILVPLCIRTANERDNIVFLSGFLLSFFAADRIMYCSFYAEMPGNADNIGYGNGVYVWRIGGTGTLI